MRQSKAVVELIKQPYSRAYKKARACSIHIRVYSPPRAMSWSCVPSSTMRESSIYLHQRQSRETTPQEGGLQDAVGVARQIAEAVRGEHHGLVAAQLAQALK